MYGENYFLVDYGFPIDKIGKVSHRYDLNIIDLFLKILIFATKMRGLVAEDIFKHYPDGILCDEKLGVRVG